MTCDICQSEGPGLCVSCLSGFHARIKNLETERDELKMALEEIHNWLACWSIATQEDMVQSFEKMEIIADRALRGGL